MSHNIRRRLGLGVFSTVLATGLVLAADGTAFADSSASGDCFRGKIEGTGCPGDGNGRGGLDLNLFHIHLNIHFGGGNNGGGRGGGGRGGG